MAAPALPPTTMSGPVAAGPVTAPRGSDYADLMRRVRRAGLLDRRRGYYLTKIAVTGGLLAAGWTGFVLLGDTWWQLAVAGFLAVAFTQIGFIGHDAGHRQIFGSKRANYIVGLLHGNLAIGLSYGWWVDKHNRHHAHPNDEDKDPNIGAGALVFTTRQAQASGPISRLFYRHQAWGFFPLLLEALNLRVASVRYLITDRTRSRTREALLMACTFSATWR